MVNGDTLLQSTLAAAANRLIPADAWPSATEAGVLDYISARIIEDSATWQNLVVPGLKALDDDAVAKHGQAFAELLPDHQDELLQSAERGGMKDWPVSAAEFFRTLLEYIAEGYYGDPESGGNKGSVSWKMIGFRRGVVDSDDVAGTGKALGNGKIQDVLHQQAPVEDDLRTVSLNEIRDAYDAVVIGAGAGGSVAAALLAEAGMRVLVVERGSWLRYAEIGREHLRNHRMAKYGHNTGPSLAGHPRIFISDSSGENTVLPHEGGYHNNAMTVGGGTRVYGAQAWRFHETDFRMATHYGVPDGSSLSDWPIAYADLEPYYERAEWEIGVSGDGREHLGRGLRQRDFPMPPLPRTLEARRLAAGAEKLGWKAGNVPLLINSIARDGRSACGRCGECVGFACPTNSKNGGHNTMLVRAMKTGNCDLVCETMAERIDTEAGRHASGVHLVGEVDGHIVRRHIRAGQVVVAAGAIESARLLLNSKTDNEPEGIGNRFGQVGRNLQGHVYSGAFGLFDDIIQDGLGPGVSLATCQFAHDNPEGIIGGGMLANEFIRLPVLHWYRALTPNAARWGLAGKAAMREGYLRTSHVQGPIQEIPNPDSRVSVSKTVRDKYGVPVVQLSGGVHPESLRASDMLAQHAETWLWAAGAREVWRTKAGPGLSAGQHQAGTLRMGDDPKTSVTDELCRVHGYDNLWVSDGSVHVTNGGVNPVLTIFALAFRTAENIIRYS